MNTQLTTVPQPGAVALPDRGSFGIEGLEDLGRSDIILPRWKIVQSTIRQEGMDKYVGQFLRNLDSEVRASLDVVILQITPGRLLWSGDIADNRPECFSRDGVTGSMYGPCNACEFNPQVNPELRTQLDENRGVADRKSQPKVCGYGYNLILVDDLDAETLALFGVMGTSVRPLKVLTTQFVQKKRSPFSAIVHLETERQVNDRGKFYVLKPRIAQWLDETATAKWRERYLEVKGAVVHDIDEEPEPGEEKPPF